MYRRAQAPHTGSTHQVPCADTQTSELLSPGEQNGSKAQIQGLSVRGGGTKVNKDRLGAHEDAWEDAEGGQKEAALTVPRCLGPVHLAHPC